MVADVLLEPCRERGEVGRSRSARAPSVSTTATSSKDCHQNYFPTNIKQNSSLRHWRLDGNCQSMTVPTHEVITAYRHLYQHLLRAVRYAKPARFVCQDKVRSAFRNGKREDFDAQRIYNTLHFLDCASKSNGLEHKILKNFVFVEWERKKGEARPRCVSSLPPFYDFGTDILQAYRRWSASQEDVCSV